jgi:coenzyme Q-binding protein COQ10
VTLHRETLDLPFRPEDLFELASEVERYPEFISWIRSLKVSGKTVEGERSRCRAEATVGFKGFHETFVTDVDARRDSLAINVSLVRGPFRKLRNKWQFAPSETGSRVDFLIEFEFRNFVLQAVADANKSYAIRRVIDAFVKEAGRRYAGATA